MKIKIFGTPWHVAHQYSLMTALKDVADFYFVVNSVRKWGSPRPLPENLHWVPYYEPGKYDFAILHVDQQCIDPSLGKSRLYKELNETVKDIPKVVINHGTPFWPELFTEDFIRTQMKLLIGENYMIVNSHQAEKMWGEIGSGRRTIIHGMAGEGWKDLPKEPRVITSLSPAGLDRYYNRNLLIAVKDKLKQMGIPHIWITVDWLSKNFEDYQDFIGRSLLYFNPTLESPMPRSRTEAMLSGCCVLTLPNHGAEEFIKNGENGFHVPNNPDAIAKTIKILLEEHYSEAAAIGQKGKQTAETLFSKDRYRADWEKLINDILKK